MKHKHKQIIVIIRLNWYWWCWSFCHNFILISKSSALTNPFHRRISRSSHLWRTQIRLSMTNFLFSLKGLPRSTFIRPSTLSSMNNLHVAHILKFAEAWQWFLVFLDWLSWEFPSILWLCKWQSLFAGINRWWTNQSIDAWWLSKTSSSRPTKALYLPGNLKPRRA